MHKPIRPIAISVLVGSLLWAGCTTPDMFMPSPEELEKMQKAMDAKNNPPPPPPSADTVGCDLAKSGLTSIFPGALIREYQPAGKDSCGYAIDGPRSEQGTDVLAGLRAPFSTWIGDPAWTEDPAARMDSAGGTSFAFGNGSRLCSVKTSWDGKGAAASTYFKVEAVCAPAAGAAPAAGSDPAIVPPPAPIPAPATP